MSSWWDCSSLQRCVLTVSCTTWWTHGPRQFGETLAFLSENMVWNLFCKLVNWDARLQREHRRIHQRNCTDQQAKPWNQDLIHIATPDYHSTSPGFSTPDLKHQPHTVITLTYRCRGDLNRQKPFYFPFMKVMQYKRRWGFPSLQQNYWE